MEKQVFSQNTIEQAVKAIKAHEVDIKSMKSDEMSLAETIDAAQKMLIQKFGFYPIESKAIVENLLKGIENFDTQYKANMENEKVVAADKLAEMTKDMSDEERINYCANLLTALQLLKQEDVSEDMITQKQKENAEKTVEVLTAEIEVLLNEGISLETLAGAVQNGVAKEALAKIAETIEMNKDYYRLLTALWLYIDQREGNIKLDETGKEIPTELLGVLAGAGIEVLIATNELNEGKIDLKRWQVILKFILGAALVAGAIVLVAYSAAILAAGVLLFFTSIFGISTWVFIVTFIIGAYLCALLGEVAGEYLMKLFDYLSDIYDKYIQIVTQKVSAWIAVIKGKVTNTVQKQKAKETDTDENETESTEAMDPTKNKNEPNRGTNETEETEGYALA